MVKEKPEDKNVLTFFKESVTPRFAAGGALEPEYKELSDTRVLMDIKHCAYVQMYKDMGRADLGPLLSCQRDEFLLREWIRAFVLSEPVQSWKETPSAIFVWSFKTSPKAEGKDRYVRKTG